jgi:hypothetical protein
LIDRRMTWLMTNRCSARHGCAPRPATLAAACEEAWRTSGGVRQCSSSRALQRAAAAPFASSEPHDATCSPPLPPLQAALHRACLTTHRQYCCAGQGRVSSACAW